MPADRVPTFSRFNAVQARIGATTAPTTYGQPPAPVAAQVALTAVVYCEGNFGGIDGKTANGLVRHSEVYDVVAVIDSDKQGEDAGTALGDKPNGIPVCADLDGALTTLGVTPAYFIFGMAPASGMLSAHERRVVLSAIALGMNIVNGPWPWVTRTRIPRVSSRQRALKSWGRAETT